MIGGRSLGLLALLAVGCKTPEAPVQLPTRRVALVFVGHSEADRALAVQAAGLLDELAASCPQLDLVHAAKMAPQAGTEIEELAESCGADLRCLGELATRVESDELIVARAVSTADGALLQFLSIPAGGRQVERRAQVPIDSVEGIRAELASSFEAITGAALPAASAAPPPQLNGKEPVAKCISAAGTVRVRRGEGLHWEELKANAPLWVGDLIESGAASTATIRYASGVSFELAPSSLVVVEGSQVAGAAEGREQITVRAGSIRGTTADESSPILVRTPDGESIELAAHGSAPVAYRVGVRDGQKVEVAVSQGEALVKAGTRSAVLRAGTAQDVRRGAFVGATVKLPDFPALQAPGVDATVQLDSELEIELQWGAVAKVAEYHIQVAKDPSFQHLLVDAASPAESWMFRPGGVGTLYWRVASRDSQGRESDFGFARRLIVTPEQIPDLLLTPAAGAALRFAPYTPRFVTFSWRAALPPASYVLVVAAEPDLLAGPVLSITTQAQKVSTRQLAPGTYYWGVFAEREGRRKPIFREPRLLSLTE